MKDFILSFKEIITVFIFVAIIASVQLAVAIGIDDIRIVASDLSCSVDSARTSSSSVTLDLRCGEMKAFLHESRLVAAFINDRATLFNCDIRKDGHAKCDPQALRSKD